MALHSILTSYLQRTQTGWVTLPTTPGAVSKLPYKKQIEHETLTDIERAAWMHAACIMFSV